MGSKEVLLPAGCHHEADHGDAKTDQDVPVAKVQWGSCPKWKLRTSDVVSDNPDQTDNHEAKHHRLKPNWVQ